MDSLVFPDAGACEDSGCASGPDDGEPGLEVETLFGLWFSVVTSAGFDGPTAARRTLSAILVTTATRSSSSKTIEPTSPSDTDWAVTYDEGWLAGFTPVRLPLEAFFA